MNKTLEQVVILFAGDSGDGMQLTGSQFTNTSAHVGNDISTFPDFPAEIRAPQGTIAGVSGFQLQFGSININTPGDECDVMIAMNAAAYIKNKNKLKEGGILIANEEGFNKKNLALCKLAGKTNPLVLAREKFQVHTIDIVKHTFEALRDSGLSRKEIDRSKNMFALGFVYWLFNRPIDFTITFLKDKFKKHPDILAANIKVIKAGYHFGEVSDTFTERYKVLPAKMKAGIYRSITGNHALAIGAIAAAQKSGLDLFYAGYPITPASDILHYLAKYKNYNVKTYQAEDEIAAVTAAIGSSFGGNLALTASSGPGIALKGEGLGLALMLELPLVIVNVQRGGPSTGLPTKTEQADLLQAVYGRNGEAPLIVLAANSPKDCFYMIYEACRLSIEHMTPVMLLTDGYIANGSEPWNFPSKESLPEIKSNFVTAQDSDYQPYRRNENLVRQWAIPGMMNKEHRVGGLEKQDITGDVSYNPENHERMVLIRQEKVKKVEHNIPLAKIVSGKEDAKVLLLGWGSTYGSIEAAMQIFKLDDASVAHIHLNYINPFPKNLKSLLSGFDTVIVPEINQGQLIKLIRSEFLIDAVPLNKTQGVPFKAREIVSFTRSYL